MPNLCPLCDTVARCHAGEHPDHILTLTHCEVLLGENQGMPGWCVLVLRHHAEHLDELALQTQEAIFGEAARVARAIRGRFGPVRINYECLGNQVGHIHWHVIPRHADDPAPKGPVWGLEPATLRGTMGPAERLRLSSDLRDRLRAMG